VAVVRRGCSQRAAAARYGVALCTVQRWCQRARGQRLDRMDWTDHSSAPRRTRRTLAAAEQQVLTIRRWLKKHSVLGECGATAIWQEMENRGIKDRPSIRTIGRILLRRGALDSRRRTRRPAPPKGWYLPEVAAERADLDSFDTIEGLAIHGGPHFTVFTGISLHGGLVTASPERQLSAKTVVDLLRAHWKEVGLPQYAQFDNDQRFTGPRQYADTVGRVSRLCLSLGLIPVFAPPNEMGFQAAIEGFNGQWQAKLWSRYRHRSVSGLKDRSARYVAAMRQRRTARQEQSPPRCAFPSNWRLDLQKHPCGKMIFLRRTDDRGRVNVLSHWFTIHRNWLHRLVRAEVDLNQSVIRFFALRRRDPSDQPLLKEVAYALPRRPFKE